MKYRTLLLVLYLTGCCTSPKMNFRSKFDHTLSQTKTENIGKSITQVEKVYESIEKAFMLHEKGILSKEEFTQEKSKLLTWGRTLNSKKADVQPNIVTSTIISETNNQSELAPLKPLSNCETITVKFSKELQQASETFCSGHTVSLKYYKLLNKGQCGDYSKLINISSKGIDEHCDQGSTDR